MPEPESGKGRQPRQGNIGLSFSGGGFRATAFSLGTMTLLQNLGLLAKAKVMSSVSGGSLALAAYLCAKAGSDAKQEGDFRFDDYYYQPLMDFLEGERLAESFLDIHSLLKGEKLILKAADETDAFLRERLNNSDGFSNEAALLGNKRIAGMLANDKLSPDFIFFNATNIRSLDLFRFGIQRATKGKDSPHSPPPVFVLNRYFLRHDHESIEGINLYHHAQKIRLADCVAASFGFPGGFEPLLFPDDFFRPSDRPFDAVEQQPGQAHEAVEARKHFRGDLICDYKQYLAFLDGGLYDNLGLASVEDVRRFLNESPSNLLEQKEVQKEERKQAVRYVIATDVDQIPTQFTAYTDPEADRQAQSDSPQPKPASNKPCRMRLMATTLFTTLRQNPLIKTVLLAILTAIVTVALYNNPLKDLLAGLSGHAQPSALNNDFLSLALRGLQLLGVFLLALFVVLLGLLAVLLLWIPLTTVLLMTGLWLGLDFGMRRSGQTPRRLLGLSSTFAAEKSLLNSWWHVAWGSLKQFQRDPQPLLEAISSRRIGQLMPAFSGYLKRTRSLTYGYLQQAYKRQDYGNDCHLIRNMIFELTPGREIDPDYAANLITLPISDYRHEERLNPVSPIARKMSRARAVCTLLEALKDPLHGTSPQDRSMRLLLMQDLNLGAGERWTSLAFEFEGADAPGVDLGERDGPLLLRLLTAKDGQLLPQAHQILKDLNLQEANQIWRWLCDNLACFEERSVGESEDQLDPPSRLSQEIVSIVTKIRQAFKEQIGDNEQLIKCCSVSLEESTSSYSWIPLLCEMATNVPTTLWLKGSCWYLPNVYDSHLRICRNGQWSITKPEDDPERQAIDLSALGPAPAAAVCTVAGYVSTCFNLLEFFYSWLGDCPQAKESLRQRLEQESFAFTTSEQVRELEDLPYALRRDVWRQLKEAEMNGVLPAALSPKLALLEAPLNRRNGLPDSYWAGRDED